MFMQLTKECYIITRETLESLFEIFIQHQNDTQGRYTVYKQYTHCLYTETLPLWSNLVQSPPPTQILNNWRWSLPHHAQRRCKVLSGGATSQCCVPRELSVNLHI